MTSTATPTSTPSLDEKEKLFRSKLTILEQLETEINSMNKNYSEGQLSLGLASFQNENIHHHLQPKAFSVGPASLATQFDINKKQFTLKEVPKKELKFIYTENVEKEQSKKEANKKNKICYLVTDEEEDEAYLKEEQERLEKEYKEKGNNPLQQLGIQYPSQAVMNAQSYMRKTLESALKIANLLQSLK